MKTEIKIKQGGGYILLIVIVILILAGGFFYTKYKNAKQDNITLQATKTALLNDTIIYYEAKNGKLVAEVEQVMLEKKELDKYNTQIKADLKNMKIKLRDAEMYISTQIETNVKPPDMPLKDTVYIEKEKLVLAKYFSWEDAWGGMSGIIHRDTLKQPNYYSRDTIAAVGTKIYKYKFLGLRFKVIGAKLKVSNKNPHSDVALPEYVKLE